DGGLRGQQHGDRLILIVELRGADLLCEIEIAEDAGSPLHRHTEERLHGRVMRREAVPLRMAIQVRRPNRLGFADYMTEQTATSWRVADARAQLGGDAR